MAAGHDVLNLARKEYNDRIPLHCLRIRQGHWQASIPLWRQIEEAKDDIATRMARYFHDIRYHPTFDRWVLTTLSTTPVPVRYVNTRYWWDWEDAIELMLEHPFYELVEIEPLGTVLMKSQDCCGYWSISTAGNVAMAAAMAGAYIELVATDPSEKKQATDWLKAFHSDLQATSECASFNKILISLGGLEMRWFTAQTKRVRVCLHEDMTHWSRVWHQRPHPHLAHVGVLCDHRPCLPAAPGLPGRPRRHSLPPNHRVTTREAGSPLDVNKHCVIS